MNNTEYRNERLDFKRLGLYFRKRIWIVLLMAFVGGLIGALGFQIAKSIKMPVEYESVSKLYIKFNEDAMGEVYQYYNGYTWNELLDSEPIMECIMGYLPGYDPDMVREATEASILSDIRLLTVTVTGENEKKVREIQSAIENGLTIYATGSDELLSVTTIRSQAPRRVYWENKTFTALISGALILGIIAFLIYCFAFVTDDAIYVQSDLEKRFDIKVLGISPRSQKGLQPYLQELKANLLYELKERRNLIFIDIDNHSELRSLDLEKLLNWQEAGCMDGLSNVTGEVVWHIREEEEDEDLFNEKEEKEWTITPLNSDRITAEECEKMRKAGGVLVLLPFGSGAASRNLERVLSLLKNQDVNIYGIMITEADEEYLMRYYS